jgi:glucose/arabinose dehydrogenase
MGRVFVISLACCLVSQSAYAADAIQNMPSRTPLVPRIAQSNLAIELTDFARIPASDKNPPLARINFLFHAGDGSGRLFVNDMRGKIYVIRDGAVLPIPFLDIGAARSPHFFSEDGEHGLVTFAFHPDFAKRGAPGYGKFYTIHSERGGLEGNEQTPLFHGPKPVPDHFKIICEWTIDPKNPDRIDPASRREILRLAPWRQDHGGGQLGFDPNLLPRDSDYGLLYISVGDGGNSVPSSGKVDFYAQAQDLTTPFGKILRINPLPFGARPYSVPKTNPFVNRTGALPEIWAYGLRNPERFSWDRGGTHKMLIADIGQASVEEINLGKAGANYGWSTYEGDFIVDHQNEKNLAPLPGGTSPAGYTFPVAAYGHSDGSAITGGFVYRGKLVPELTGKYVFGDLANGALFYADGQPLEAGVKTPIFRLRIFYRGEETTMSGVVKNDRADLRLGLSEDGEIYVLTKTDGKIRKIVHHAA